MTEDTPTGSWSAEPIEKVIPSDENKYRIWLAQQDNNSYTLEEIQQMPDEMVEVYIDLERQIQDVLHGRYG